VRCFQRTPGVFGGSLFVDEPTYLNDQSAGPEEGVVFLSIDEVNGIHEDAIRHYSPTESLAIRDQGLLESAVAAPQQTWGGHFLYESLEEMAAAYLISLNQNHAYENGNKRTAFQASAMFLRMNGYQLTLSQEEAVDLTLRIARHEIEREEVIAIIVEAIQDLP
jgi:death on curing protein